MSIRKELPLYGEAAAIRALYQTSLVDPHTPKPPRPKPRRGLWLARLVDALSPVLREPVASKA